MNKISHDLHESGNIWKHPGSCSSNKHCFPVPIILPPFLSTKSSLFFPVPHTHTHTLTGLPITAFASSVCRLHLPKWWTAFHQNNTLRPRHKQFMLLHTYRLDFSLQPIPDFLTGLHLFGNIFSCRKRENTTKLGKGGTYPMHTWHGWLGYRKVTETLRARF